MLRAIPVPAAAVAVLLALTGCAAAPTPTATATATPTPTVSDAASPAPTVTVTATSSPTPTPAVTAAAATRCTLAHLDVRMELPGADQSAMTMNWVVRFTNTGSSPCTLEGAPGVSLVTGTAGRQLGASAATREPAGPPTVRLAPGAAASAGLTMPDIAYDGPGYPDCDRTEAAGFRIYPPKSTSAAFVRESDLYGCTTQRRIMTVRNVTG